MDIQELLPSSNDQPSIHYADAPSTSHQYHHSSLPATQPQTTSQQYSNLPHPLETTTAPALTTIHEDESLATNNSMTTDPQASQQQQQQQQQATTSLEGSSSGGDTDFLPLMNPALSSFGGRFDKRKSSPAILGLPFGITDDPQLDLHLSQHRNSIEAAMLLANFNRAPTITKDSPEDTTTIRTQQQQWQDDLAVPTHTQEKEQQLNLRRHSYDVDMNWKSMSQQFKERTDLFNKGSAFKPVLKQEQQDHLPYTGGNGGSHITWTQDGLTRSSSYPTIHPHLYPSNQAMPPVLHPLAQQHSTNEAGQKRTYLAPREHYSYYGDRSIPQPYYFPPPHVIGKLPLPSSSSSSTGIYLQPGDYPTGYQPPPTGMPPPVKPKRRRFPKEEEIVEAGDADFPDMCPRDVELARTDPEARPRRQKLRFNGDMYTPKWVRFNGQSKEGLCDTCEPGRWLQLKNSAYWYHKQFYHGISSVSGAEFVKPVDTRWVDQDLVEGLCHQCQQWVAVSNVKRKNSVLWFRHAHKCHVYHKPKTSYLLTSENNNDKQQQQQQPTGQLP
ncbi:hypothetical protein BC941DRAFT_472984 [Chlamydoabsidia padenii]|nr:hypothetical protein BC941DRAFT_472984 [Chlamydoabsidia padenii]